MIINEMINDDELLVDEVLIEVDDHQQNRHLYHYCLDQNDEIRMIMMI
jgi:hypothetical protein